ncbi:MAG: hypothetical protein NTW28_30385 [Candidatus Solibacter sp.]|nr:hypothetical protein [Candidatus Solibacter sp.]
MMLLRKFAGVLLVALPALAAQVPLPELRTEATDGGSIFYIKNNSSVALTAYLIELVNYPGSSYSFWQDETVAEPIPPKGEKRIQVANMTVGAVPDYVKMQAALYTSGTSAGIPEKVAQLLERRRATLDTTRQLMARIEKAQSEGTMKSALISDLKQWADTLQPAGKGNRNSQAAINQAAARGVILGTAAKLDALSFAESLGMLRGWERALASVPGQ